VENAVDRVMRFMKSLKMNLDVSLVNVDWDRLCLIFTSLKMNMLKGVTGLW